MIRQRISLPHAKLASAYNGATRATSTTITTTSTSSACSSTTDRAAWSSGPLPDADRPDLRLACEA
jgi:hypothetical protein